MEKTEKIVEDFKAYQIQFGDISYKYYLYNNQSEQFLQKIKSMDDVDTIVVISDKNVSKLYGESIVKQLNDRFQSHLLELECTEKTKNLQVLGELIDKVLSLKVTRRTCIIGLGGGICGNMSGMVAALLFRGIKFVHMPTSLMAISDSVLSLKQAINSNYGKNLIGLFYTPEMVIANVDFLLTSPKFEIISGLCEIIKNALTILPESIVELNKMFNSECSYTMKDYSKFIEMAIKAKTLVMQNDPFEKQDALILEYGHTIGHAIELAAAGLLPHGEAVGLGMICAAKISQALGYLSEDSVDLHLELLDKAGASTKIPIAVNHETILSYMKFDNKRGYVKGEDEIFHMILLEDLGIPLRNEGKLLTKVPEKLVREVIISMYQ